MSQTIKYYAQLGKGYNSSGPAGIPVNTKAPTGQMIVPVYKAIGYDALINAKKYTGTHFNITNAYGARAGSCGQQYLPKTCGN